MKRILLAAGAAVLSLSLFAGCGKKGDVVQIGHKNYTEQRILGQMLSVLLEEKLGYATEVREFGGTNIVFEALRTGDVAMYPEYTGTAYGSILGESGLKDAQEVYNHVKQVYRDEYGLLWLEQMGFNNTYTFAVLPEVAEAYNLKTFSDLSKVAGELTMVSTTEFLEREDGLPGVKEAYGGFEFGNTMAMDPGLRYAAISEKKGDVMDAFSTDGKLIEFELVVLEDDLGFFPPYFVAPLLNGAYAEEHPEVVEELNRLQGNISDEEMQQMNYQVDNLGVNEKEVAREFLESKGLLDQ
ncbi:glycine/betaine ABC transporter substrate-binding protein [Clostridiales bacterium F-3ap]|uniref:Glycine/betaine ABC transporter substrate-binding protein n=2 Tax=Anaerotalea alkaliphila TaxID=2662126 RepID=A0A7X5KME7_9FIRM|nr:glycine/betaine ABC transporter substrate-binding protein [Anaerotalea alkaliphila]